jgi:hypothetical protein
LVPIHSSHTGFTYASSHGRSDFTPSYQRATAAIAGFTAAAYAALTAGDARFGCGGTRNCDPQSLHAIVVAVDAFQPNHSTLSTFCALYPGAEASNQFHLRGQSERERE